MSYERLKGTSQQLVKQQLFQIFRDNPLYGFNIFAVSQSKEPKDAWLGISKERIVVFRRDTAEQVTQWFGTSLCVSQNLLLFSTRRFTITSIILTSAFKKLTRFFALLTLC